MHTASQAATQVYIKVQDHRSDPAGVNVELQTVSTVYTFIGGSLESPKWLLLVFYPKFWEVVGTYKWYFVILWIQVAHGGDIQTIYCNRIPLEFLHSQSVGVVKHHSRTCSCPRQPAHTQKPLFETFTAFNLKKSTFYMKDLLSCNIDW